VNNPTPIKLWSPSPEFQANSNLNAYMKWINKEKNLKFSDYNSLWHWSVDQPEDFWSSILDFFKVGFDGQIKSVLSGKMPGTRWFNGINVSYAEHIFNKNSADRPAIIYKAENGEAEELTWAELEQKVAALQSTLEAQGVGVGDRVAAYLPNIPEAIISFLAVNGLGAIWTSTSPDFGTDSIVDRIAQIEPKVLISIEEYRYGGKTFDKSSTVHDILARIPAIETLVLVGNVKSDYNDVNQLQWQECLQDKQAEIRLTRVPFNHPIWVLYSSGTTGIPKAITHSVGGILLEHLKYLHLHNNVKPGDRCFWYTTIGWMMWNYIQASLLCGGTVVLYDGSLAYPDLNVLWQFADKVKINHFGISAGFITACMKEELTPGTTFDLSSLQSIGSTGSPLPPEGFDWIYREVKKDLWLTSISGGSDVCSAFVGGNPHWPVYAGEIQCRTLGCDLDAFNEDGRSVYDEVGEMVIKKPMPSMPIFLWGDKDNARYQESYFNMFPGIWRHGDWTRITPRQGVVIYGRSDSTLNRGGVRIGTSEIYRTVDRIPEVEDSLIVNYSKDNQDRMPLFIKLKPDVSLTDELGQRIKSIIRQKTSPRHVPDEVLAIADIPYTISGKKMETPVKKILEGADPSSVAKKDAMRNPEALQSFIQLANK
jgi:acetoacetyl-CoA synthetase